jgi:hypothetical protein
MTVWTVKSKSSKGKTSLGTEITLCIKGSEYYTSLE